MNAVALSPGGKLVAGSIRKEVFVWDAPTGDLQHTLQGALGQITFLSEGKVLATMSEDGTLKFWETKSGRLLVTLQVWAAPSAERSPTPGAPIPVAPPGMEPPPPVQTEPAEWIAYTPQGYYSGSPGAERSIH